MSNSPVELRGFEPRTFSLRNMWSNACDQDILGDKGSGCCTCVAHASVARIPEETTFFKSWPDGSFEMLLRRSVTGHRKLFKLRSLSVKIKSNENSEAVTAATLTLTINRTEVETTATGDGPVNAMDLALRKALDSQYSEVTRLRLTDFKVRDLDSSDGTAARVRVPIETTDGNLHLGGPSGFTTTSSRPRDRR